MSAKPLLDNPDRIRLVFERIDRSEDEAGQAVAFNLATKALKAAGISWSDLLETHLAAEAAKKSPGGASLNSSFGDIFEGIFSSSFGGAGRPAPSAPDPQPPRRRSLQVVSGEQLPEHVIGRINVTDRRPTKTGEMLVVQVESMTHSYGPLVIFSAKDIAKFDANPEIAHFGRVRQPTSSRHLPTLYGLRD